MLDLETMVVPVVLFFGEWLDGIDERFRKIMTLLSAIDCVWLSDSIFSEKRKKNHLTRHVSRNLYGRCSPALMSMTMTNDSFQSRWPGGAWKEHVLAIDST